MIAFVRGTLRLIKTDRVVIDVAGVGYEVFVSNPYQYTLDQELFLYTYQHVREDSILLYGFDKEEDHEVFLRLINVKGIGPKTALTMLGVCSGAEMIEAIENDDVKRLKALPGIGAKTASQIVLDLKGKFVIPDSKATAKKDDVWDQCQEALLSLGYKTSQLSTIKKELSGHNLDLDTMLRRALVLLAQRNGV